MLKKAAKFANHTNNSVRKTLAQLNNIAHICDLFKANTGERAWNAVGDRLQGPCYLSRDDHDRKIRARKQRTNIGKYFIVNSTIRLCRQLSVEALVTFPSKTDIFRNMVKK
jgi:hypothetical protein